MDKISGLRYHGATFSTAFVLLVSAIVFLAMSMFSKEADLSAIAAIKQANPGPSPKMLKANEEAETRFELHQAFTQIQDAINSLREMKNFNAATKLDAEFKVFKEQMAGPYNVPATGRPEVHVIGIGPRQRQYDESKSVTIDIGYKSNPIILVINASPPVLNCHLRIASGVRIAKVIIAGGTRLKMHGFPPGIPVEEGLTLLPSDSELAVYQKDDIQIGEFQQLVQRKTGLTPTVFISDAGDDVFAIGPANNEWRYQHILSRMSALIDKATVVLTRGEAKSPIHYRGLYTEQLAASAFELPFFSGAPTCAAEFDENGPIESTLKKIDMPVEGSVFDPKTDQYFAVNSYNLYSINPSTGHCKAIPLPPGPPLGLRFVTLDWQAGCLYLPTESALIRYDIRSGKFSTTGKFDFSYTVGMVFSPANHCFYESLDITLRNLHSCQGSS